MRSGNGPGCDATETDADGERILQLLMHAFPPALNAAGVAMAAGVEYPAEYGSRDTGSAARHQRHRIGVAKAQMRPRGQPASVRGAVRAIFPTAICQRRRYGGSGRECRCCWIGRP